MIVSVSRRCDIPRFQFDWFMERINEGFVDTINPFNSSQVKRISLMPKDGVDAFVFWTRYPKHILTHADELIQRGYPFYVMVSVTNYPDILEPNQAFVPDVLKSMKMLSEKIGTDKVIWRYDPVILTNITNDEFHYKNFKELAENLSGSVKRVIISIYDEYRGAKKRLNGLSPKNDFDNYYGVLLDLSEIAKEKKIEIQSCAEKEDLSSIGIKKGACIDASLIEKICGVKTLRDKNQRPNCLCSKSIDIGTYGTCPAKCAYCYAW